MTFASLTSRLRAAAEYLTLVGWSRDAEVDEHGAVSIIGAVLGCAPRTGDEQLIIQVLRQRETAEHWNSRYATEEDVFVYLSTATIDDAALAETFGPRWHDVVELVRAAATIDQQSFIDLGLAHLDQQPRTGHLQEVLDTWDSSTSVLATNAYEAASQASMSNVAVEQSVMPVVPLGAQAAGWAAWATSRFDGLEAGTITQTLVDQLMHPWTQVMGAKTAALEPVLVAG